MGYVLKAVLSSAQHPEYGQITVPFPIPDEKYDRMIELLEPLEIGDALRQDCRVDELDSFYTVLNRLVGSLVNFDELDYTGLCRIACLKATSTISLPWRNKQREKMTDKREPPVSRLAALFYSCGRKMEAYRFRNHSILCWFSNGYKMVFFHNRTTRTNVL